MACYWEWHRHWLIYITSFCTAVTTVPDKGTAYRKKHSFGKVVSAHGYRHVELFVGSQSEARTGAGFHLQKPTLRGLTLLPASTCNLSP